MNTRLLGTLCMIGGLAYVVEAIYASTTGSGDRNSLNILLGMVWAFGAACGWLGFILIRGTGDNIAVRFLSFIPIVGLTLVFMIGLFALLTGAKPFEIPLTGVGLVVELVGIVLNTIFAIATRALSGWRKFAPLAVLLGVVLGGVITTLTQGEILAIPLGLGIAYGILGYAVQSTESDPQALAQPA